MTCERCGREENQIDWRDEPLNAKVCDPCMEKWRRIVHQLAEAFMDDANWPETFGGIMGVTP